MVKLIFGKPGYIAHPYWPEMYRLIEIQKTSGINRARSEKRRREALEATLRSMQLSLDDYTALQAAALRPFHTNGDGTIIIPADRVASCLVNACDEAPARLRISNLRNALRISDFKTGKSAPDGVWSRFAVVQSASNKLSNQRGLRENSYIENFTATGTIEGDPEMVKPEAVIELLEFAGREIGIGASRKMGWGRFAVEVK